MKNLAVAMVRAHAEFKLRAQPLNRDGRLFLQLLESGAEFVAVFTPQDALQFVKAVQPYNSMKDLPKLIESINRIMPRCGYSLPAQQDPPCHFYRIGNESSLVIYVHLRSDDMHKLGGPLKTCQFVEQIKNMATEAGAQEFHVCSMDPMKFEGLKLRIWWD
jgi:hypothetical protein